MSEVTSEDTEIHIQEDFLWEWKAKCIQAF